MKNYLFLLFISLLILSVTSCIEEDPDTKIDDTPVSIERFEVNFEEIDPNGGMIEHKRDDPFRIDFQFKDEGELKDYSFYFLLNDDENKKWTLSYETVLNVSEMGFGYTFSSGLSTINLDPDIKYETEAGDGLYFYGYVFDDTNNETTFNIIVKLTD